MSIPYLKQKFSRSARDAFGFILSSSNSNNIDLEIVYHFLTRDIVIISTLKDIINNQTLQNQLINDINAQLNINYSLSSNVINAIKNIPSGGNSIKPYLLNLNNQDINDLLDFLDYISKLKLHFLNGSSISNTDIIKNLILEAFNDFDFQYNLYTLKKFYWLDLQFLERWVANSYRIKYKKSMCSSYFS